MRKIERYYLKQVISFWLILSLIIVSIESLLAASKEYTKLSESYTPPIYSQYLLSEALGLFIEMTPITLFLSIVIVHWQWGQKSLWISAALSGQNEKSWFRLGAYLIMIVLTIVMALRYGVWSELAFNANKNRLIALGKISDLSSKRDLLQSDGSYLFYHDKTGNLSLFDIKKQRPILSEERSDLLKQHDSFFQLEEDLSVSLSALPLDKKIEYKKIASGKELNLLRGALLREVFYPVILSVSVILGWRSSPIQWNNRKIQLSAIKITVDLAVLYLCLKLIPLGVLFFKSNIVVWGALTFLMGAILLPSVKQN